MITRKFTSRVKNIVVLTAILFWVVIAQPAAGQSGSVLYVSPEGDNGNPGTLNKPLATFFGAAEKVQQLKTSGQDITVLFRGGHYYFDQTVVLDKDASGTENQQITYAAYPGEEPVFTSGEKIGGWQKINPKDPNYDHLGEKARQKVYVADYPRQLGTVRYLSQRNEQWLNPGKVNVTQQVTTKKFVHGHSVEGQMWDPPEEKTIAAFSRSYDHLSNVDSALSFSIYTADFELQLLPVERIAGDTLITATPGGHRLALPVPIQRHESNKLAHIHNLVEGISGPGQFACYPAEGKIYLWSKEKPEEVYAPQLNELIRIEGVPDGRQAWFSDSEKESVKNITFKDITFTNGRQPVWDDESVFAQHHWAMLDEDNALLRFRGAEDCRVTGCTFQQSGGAGVAFDLYAQNNIIENSRFEYLGYEGIRLAGYGPGRKDANKFNTIRQNTLHHVNQTHHYGAALVLWNTGFNSIRENHFHHFASRAVLFSAPRSRAFTKNNQKLFPEDRTMKEQAWPMARWSEIPDSALATIYHAKETIEGNSVNIRRVEVNGYRQGAEGGLVADRACSHYRFLKGNVVERNVIGHGAREHFADGIFYITACASGEPNKIRHNYIYNTGKGLPHAKIPFRLIYIDGYTGRFHFTENFAYNIKLRFEATAMYNWWNKVSNHSNLFYQVEGAQYGDQNLTVGPGPDHPLKKYADNYRHMIHLLDDYQWNGPDRLPGRMKLRDKLRSTLDSLGYRMNP